MWLYSRIFITLFTSNYNIANYIIRISDLLSFRSAFLNILRLIFDIGHKISKALMV